MVNATDAIAATLYNNDYFHTIGAEFSQFHRQPLNVLLHFLTTPLAIIGFFGLLKAYTKSSSPALSLLAVYLLTLLPVLPSGEFIGTMLVFGAVVMISAKIELSYWAAAAAMVAGYLLQDLAHLGTGEATFQSTYSGGGAVDLAHPLQWAMHLLEHAYYLVPLCVHVLLPLLGIPPAYLAVLQAPLPTCMWHLHAFGGLLLPLVSCALGSYCLDSKNSFCFFPGAPYFYRICQCSLLSTNAGSDGERQESRKEDMSTIRAWAMAQGPAEKTSSHWWYAQLPQAPRAAFDAIAHASQIHGMFRTLFSEKNYFVEVVEGMNEVYVSAPVRDAEASNSDHVFFNRHVDGPFGFIPFVSVYRCIVGLDANYKYVTQFPIAHMGVNAVEGDVLAFDYNREVHYIAFDDSKKDAGDKFRVTLKLHYCIYPRVLAPLGWLMKRISTTYNASFRALFLKTINPSSLYEHFLAWNVNFNTLIFDRMETLLGWRNITYVAVVCALWAVTGVYSVFMSLTSFVHYFRYISTFYVREGIDFGSFKRDVMLFKNLALVQLFYLYLFPAAHPFAFDPLSVFMIITGYSVSLMAFMAIGVDRTYFGAELGLMEPKWINKFPYGYIPHPMIMAQVFALLGFYKAAHFRHEWPYLVPIHVALYVTHALQEEFDFYKKPSGQRAVAGQMHPQVLEVADKKAA